MIEQPRVRLRADKLAIVRRDAAPRYSLVETAIREQIAAGELRADDRLPNEVEMAQRYGVSRSVIRQALDILERDGLVSRQRAKGTFITAPSLALPVEQLASFAEEIKLHGLVASSVVLVADEVPANTQIATVLGIESGTVVPYIERLRLGGDEVLGWDVTWVHPELAASLERIDLEHEVLFDAYRMAGREVSTVSRRVRSLVADPDLASKLSVDPGAPLLEIARVVHDAEGRTLDRQVRIYRGDRFTLALDDPGAEPTLSPSAPHGAARGLDG